MKVNQYQPGMRVLVQDISTTANSHCARLTGIATGVPIEKVKGHYYVTVELDPSRLRLKSRQYDLARLCPI